jgi:recombination protein RecR
MIQNVPTLAQLIKTLQQVPYLASKNIYKVANHFLHMDEKKIEQFCAALRDAKAKITQCDVCAAWQEKGHPCSLCTSPKRDQSTVCVVETWQEFLAIEKTGGYHGVYHILGGAISPLEGINPEDLTINQLIVRVQSGTVKEVILATNNTPEGEATASFIASKIKSAQVPITCLARGVPVGSSLEYMDRVTVYKALSDRRPF